MNIWGRVRPLLWRAVQWVKEASLWQRVALAAFLLVIAQLCIPTGLVSLQAKVDGESVGLMNFNTLKSMQDGRKNAMPLRLGAQVIDIQPADAGITITKQAAINSLPRVTQKTKFVPMLPVYLLLLPGRATTEMKVDEAKNKQYATELSYRYFIQPEDATPYIKDGKLQFTSESNGERYSPDKISASLKGSRLLGDIPYVEATSVDPEVTKEELQYLAASYKQISGSKLEVSVGSKSWTIESTALSSWLMVTKSEQDTRWQLAINPDAFDPEYQKWVKEGSASSTSKELTLTVGSRKKVLTRDNAVTQLNSWLGSPATSRLTFQLVDLKSVAKATPVFTGTSAGLQARINDWVMTHNGTYSVVVKELGGKERSASFRASSSVVAASTYKLFVAYAAYHLSEAGTLDLNQVILEGKTIEQCIQVAIVNSDNNCAIAVAERIGWAQIDAMLAEAGYQNIRLNNYSAPKVYDGEKIAPASELAKLLEKLHVGTLLNPSNTAKLLGYMKSQVYRQGIPAGAKGATVADKVGFLYGYLHDAAIVYTPSSTYVLVIMTDGSSWQNIASLTKAINESMNQ